MMALALSCSFIGRSISSGGGTLYALRFTAGPNPTGTEDGNRIETRIDSSGDPWRVDATVPPIPIGEYLDETLTLYAANTLYNWQIVPFDEVGDGSTYGPFTTYTRPSVAPSNLVADPVSSSQINLTWTPGNSLDGDRIYLSLAGETLAVFDTAALNEGEYSITGRAASEGYDIAVVGYNDNSAYGFADAETDKDSAGAFTTQKTLPAVVSITVGQSQTTVVFSEAMVVGDDTNVPALTLSGGAITLAYDSGAGTNTWVYDNSRDVGFSETGTGAYTQAGDGLQAADGRELLTFTGKVIVNSSDFGAITYLGGTSNIGVITSTPLDMTAADLIVILAGGQFIGDGEDSEENVWIPLEQTGGGSGQKLFYCLNPDVSATQVFEASGGAYNVIAAAGFSGVTGFDKSTGLFTSSSTTSIQPGAQTPASAPSLSVIGLTFGDVTSEYDAAGYTTGPNTPAETRVN